MSKIANESWYSALVPTSSYVYLMTQLNWKLLQQVFRMMYCHFIELHGSNQFLECHATRK